MFERLFNRGKTVEQAKPKTEKELQLEFLYGSLRLTLSTAREELIKNPNHLDMVRDGMGARIKQRVERITNFMLESACYASYEDRKFIEIGDDLWFVFEDNNLVKKNIKTNILGQKVCDYKNATKALNEDWFDYGEEVADSVIKLYAYQARLPENILDYLKRG